MKSFLVGIASLTNIFGSMQLPSPTKGRTDSEALASDWYNVGNDICNAIKKSTSHQAL